MSYCLNPVCQTQNPGDANFCQNCGSRLLLDDRYRALKPIGQGGFGRTFLAIDEADSTQPYCVIKQFLPRNQGHSKAADLFRQEAARLEQLGQHPQIPRLLAHLERDQGQYLIQEFIDGQNLAEVMAAGESFGEVRIRSLLNDLLPVLRFIHGHQIIHRDIKPENIICPSGGDQLVLVDFGASKHATDTALARTGTVIGSAEYVAPEQAMGRAEFASDLYSLGVTCVHLLTAIHPFDLYSVSEDAWIWQQYLTEPVSEELGRVLDKMLQRATSQRYRTATAVLQDLSLEPSAIRVSKISAIASPPSQIPSALSPIRPTSDPSQPWQCVQTLTGHLGSVTTVAVSPDGQSLASGSGDRTIKLWSLVTGELLHTFSGRSLWFGSGHSDRIRAVTFSPDGQTLISGSDDGAVKLWDLNTKKLISTLAGHDWGIAAIAISTNGQTLASGDEHGAIKLWDWSTEALIGSLIKHRERISSLVISPDGQTLISGSYDKTIRLWDLSTDRLINTLRGHSDRVSAIAVTFDWRTLISGSWDKTLKIWELSNGKQIQTLTGHSDRISCIAVSPDCQILASGGEDSTVKLWSLQSDRAVIPQEYRTRVVQHSWGINTLVFSPDGQALISGSADGTIKIWRRYTKFI